MKPILFNTEMVKAILEGRKTQTRRVIPLKNNDLIFTGFIMSSTAKGRDGFCSFGLNKEQDLEYAKQKYKVDDVLYVRETFGEYYQMCNHGNFCDCEPEIIYKAGQNGFYDTDIIRNWKPSIHMPKEYARIFLKVTNVKIERLQDISLKDILKEGITRPTKTLEQVKKDGCQINMNIPTFIKLWNSTAKDGYKWEDNPYVFVYEFERIHDV